jgi:glutamate:Na+ symporter, ESS family
LIALGGLASLLAACLVLLLGNTLATRVGLLARCSVPGPVVGGLAFAVAAFVLERATGHRLSLENATKSDLLLVFFACLGLTSDLRQLARGGARLFRFLLVLIPFLFAQDALGVAMARLLGLHPFLGLVAGSMTLGGGHGTGAAYVERFGQASNIPGIMELAMTSATLGLVIGGVVGGPVAERLIRRHRLAGERPAEDTSDIILGPVETPIAVMPVIGALTAALIAVLTGRLLAGLLADAPIAVPDFLLCLIAGLVLRNVGGLLGFRPHDPAADLLGSVSLSLFLAWTMMGLDLGALSDMAGPLLVILTAQIVLVSAWASVVTFRAVGGDYEAAVTTAAFCGFGMGATATAIANMQALANRHGPAPQSFLIVPIVGAFFIDIANAVVLTFFLSLRVMGF